MANLPENWCVCSLDDVLSYEQPQPYIVKNANYSDDYKIPVLTAGKSFIIGYTKEETGVYDKLPAIIFDDFTTSSKIVNFKFKVKSSAMKILKPRLSELNLHFFYYLMQTIECNHNTHKRYWISDFSQKEILLPPLAEQERIVQKIEELFAEIDAGIENLKIVKNQIKLYRQSVLKNAFNQDCEKKFLKNYIAEMNYGTSEKTNDDKNGIPVLRMGDIQNGKLNFDNLKFLDTIKDGKLILKKGDLLFNRTNSSELVGKSAVFKADRKCSFASYIIKVRFDDTLNSDYVCFYINSPYGRQWARSQLTQQVGQANINGKKLQELQIPVPSLAEQERIVAEIETRFERADAMELAVQNALDTAEKLKQAILKKAFRGELVPQNPNDEPASVLLERIRAQRTAEEKKTKGKSRS